MNRTNKTDRANIISALLELRRYPACERNTYLICSTTHSQEYVSLTVTFRFEEDSATTAWPVLA